MALAAHFGGVLRFRFIRVPAGWSWRCASGRGGPRAFRLLDDRPKCLRLTNLEFCQALAVDFDTGLGEAIDEARIGEALLAHRRVQALNPQGAKNPLLGAPVARRIL